MWCVLIGCCQGAGVQLLSDRFRRGGGVYDGRATSLVSCAGHIERLLSAALCRLTAVVVLAVVCKVLHHVPDKLKQGSTRGSQPPRFESNVQHYTGG